MTDSNATELYPRRRLHEQLDAIGVDYWCAQQATFWNGDNGSEFIAYQYNVNGVDKLAFKSVNTTPEQAVAATLGAGECEVSYEQDGIPRCSNCQNVIYDEYKRDDGGIKNYCDECGAKVRKAVKR